MTPSSGCVAWGCLSAESGTRSSGMTNLSSGMTNSLGSRYLVVDDAYLGSENL